MKRKRKRRNQQDEESKEKMTLLGDVREEEEGEEEKKKKKKKRRSYLYASEKKLDVYGRVTVDEKRSLWVPPPPPSFTLLQESHSFDPWRVLVICMLLNVTKGPQVKGVLEVFFHQCPNAEAAMNVSRDKLEQTLKPLGLQKKRARTIKIFSRQYLRKEWTHVTELHGIGKYAADAYAIFCVGKPEAVIPQDNKLVEYWKFVCEKRTRVAAAAATG